MMIQGFQAIFAEYTIIGFNLWEVLTLIKGLLQRIIRKDKQSERVLFEMFHNRVYRTAYMITNDHYLAQDVVQETFEKAFKGLDKLKDPEKTGAWLGSIATTTAMDLMRKKKDGTMLLLKTSI
jgi:DNA-directed RNA polymerase specialized sigma24 family protein